MIQTEERLLLEHLGDRTLSYLLACDLDAIHGRFDETTQSSLEGNREEVLLLLIKVDEELESISNDFLRSFEWTSRLTAQGPPSLPSVGNIFRQMAGAEINGVPENLTPLEKTLCRITIDIFPGLLIRNDALANNAGLAKAICNHPSNEEFERLILEDPELKVFFEEVDGQGGRHAYSLRSTGRGGIHQLSLFANSIVAVGLEISLLETSNPSIEDVFRGGLLALNTIRRSLGNGEARVSARIGLAGILFPPGCNELNLGWARIRREDARDAHHFASTSLTGQVAASTSTGETITIKRSGDLVLELELPFEVRLGHGHQGMDWPEDLLNGLHLVEELIQSLRLGLLFAYPDDRPILVPTWRVIIDPLSFGNVTSWSDPSRTPGLRPFQLTDEGVNSWKEWAERIHEKRSPGVGVAIRRLLMSISERYSPEDVLLDAVVVWENLFGTRVETSFRISSSLAWLLGGSAEHRLALQSRYREIYGIRSAVVHGSAKVNARALQAVSSEAVGIAISALRKVFGERSDLLELKNSEARSVKITHGA